MSVATEIEGFTGKTPDILIICKKILASEPPFAADLESHVKFANIWGGGKSQKVIRDICSYIKLNDNNYHVSSTHFDACCTLKLKPTEVPAMFVAAIIKCVATRTPNGTTLIPAKRIKIVVDEKKGEVMKANAFMVKAATLTESLAKDDMVAKWRGDFECDMVELVFGTRDKNGEDKSSQEDIVHKFITKINDCNVSAEVAVTDDGADMFDATADNTVQVILERKGVKSGAIMQPRSQGGPETIEVQFEVSHTNDDGSVCLRRIKFDGTLEEDTQVVSLDSIPDYNVVKNESRLSCSTLPLVDYTGLDVIHRMAADIALYNVYAKHHVKLGETVFVQTAPKNRLMSCCDIGAGALTLVPWSHNVQAKPLDKSSDARVRVVLMLEPPIAFGISTPAGLGKKMEVPFWRMVEEKKDKKCATMAWSTFTESVRWPVHFRKEKDVSVMVTVAVNNKPIKPFSEIRVYSEVVTKKRKAMEVTL